MKLPIILPILLIAVQVHGQKTIEANADLESVTVYSSGAEMNHKVKLELPSGSSEVVVNNVANTLDEKTIQIGANANITILSFRFTKDYLKKEIKTPAYNVLEDSITLLKQRLIKLGNERQAEASVLVLIDKNSSVSNDKTGVNVAELIKLSDFYKTKMLEISNNISRIDEQTAGIQTNISKLQMQQLEMRSEGVSNSGQIVMQIIAKNAATTNFKVSYLSPNAGWNSFYDLRADKINEPVKLSYKANVAQNTGIDWKQVKLTLSSGNPTISGIAPQISPWFLALNRLDEPRVYGQSVDRRTYTGAMTTVSAAEIGKLPVSDLLKMLDGSAPGVTMSSGSGQPGSSSDVVIRGAGSISANNTPLIVVDGAPYNGTLASINPADVESTTFLKDASATGLYGSRGTNGVILVITKNKTLMNFTSQNEHDMNTTFDIDIPYDIASNAKPHSVSLQEYSIPVQYKYVAIPKLDPDAFLLAQLTNYDKLNLLPGESNIIFDNMYVGKSFINPAATNDTLSLSMGRDKKISIKRERVASMAGIKTSGNGRKEIYTYEIKVHNGKKESISLSLKDQYPVATDKSLDIELIQSDSAEVNKETGILNWNLNIASGETKTVRMSYSVKYPANRTFANL